MQRHEQIIQLSDHVKNKLKKHQHLPSSASLIDSSDEFIEIASTDDDNGKTSTVVLIRTNLSLIESNSSPLEQETRPRCSTYTIQQVKQPSARFFTDRNGHVPMVKEKYRKQCEDCLRRNRLIDLQREDLLRLYNQNKRLNHQLGSMVLQNRQYQQEIDRSKDQLKECQKNLHELQKKLSPDSQIDDNEEEEEDGEENPVDHIKRLRYEMQMYNRLVIAKEKQRDSFL